MLITFTRQAYLAILFLIPILIFLHFYGLKNSRGKAIKFANFDAIAKIKGVDLYSKNIILLIINIAIITSISFSLSGITLHKEVDASQFTFVIAIDSSESMGATDIFPDRLSVAKKTAKEFIDSFEYIEIGVISFAGNSYIETEITSNKQKIKSSIDKIQLTKYGGTDLFESVSASMSLLKDKENKAIILLSDGQINVNRIEDVIDTARNKGIVIHTIGIGTLEGGQTSFGISKLDEDTLKSLSYNTNGEFFTIGNEIQMREAFNQIAPKTKKIAPIDLSFYMIIFALILFIIEKVIADFIKISI